MKVLIVEDDSLMAQLYGHLFKLENFEIAVASNGQEALDNVRSAQQLPNLILLDVMMPKMDGFKFLEELNKDERLKGISTIVLTNMYDDEARAKAKSLGAKDFFIKSEQNPKVLIEKIKKHLKIPNTP